MSLEKEVTAYLKQQDYLGAKLLLELKRYPNHYIHACKLLHLVNPPDLSYFEELAQQESVTNESSEHTGRPNPELINSKAPDATSLADSFILNPIPIEAIDQQTWREVSKRIGDLQEFIRTQLEDKRLAEWEKELRFIKDYLSQSTRPGGKARNLNTEERKSYQQVGHAIKRLLNTTPDPVWIGYIKSHLRSGIYYCWVDTEMPGGE